MLPDPGTGQRRHQREPTGDLMVDPIHGDVAVRWWSVRIGIRVLLTA